MSFPRVLACVCIWLLPVAASAKAGQESAPAAQVDGITRLVAAIQKATDDGDADALRTMARPALRPAQLAEFVQSLTYPRVAHATVKERDRAPVAGRIRVLLEILTERGIEGRVTTWRVDVEPVG